ncbi:hypothetical protein ABMB68_005968 [Bradyrhizobium sp. RT4a]
MRPIAIPKRRSRLSATGTKRSSSRCVRAGVPDAQAVIAALKARNIAIEILSGDREPAVKASAHALGIPEWRTGVTPADLRGSRNWNGARGRKHDRLFQGDRPSASMRWLDRHTSPEAANVRSFGLKGLNQNWHCPRRIAVATYENISGRVGPLRPSMQSNVRFSQQGYCGDAVTRTKLMNMKVE